jgi:hypothetical protein
MKRKNLNSKPAMSRHHLFFAIIGISVSCVTAASAAPSGLGIECEAFQLTGNWLVEPRDGASDGRVISSGSTGAATPAATALAIPAAGRYTLWVKGV